MRKLTDEQRSLYATRIEHLEAKLRLGQTACDGDCGKAASIPTSTGLHGTAMAHCPECWRKWWEADRPGRIARGKAAMARFLALGSA